MGIKDNFFQAVSELIGISRNVEPNKEEEQEMNAEVLKKEAFAEGAGAEEQMQETANDGSVYRTAEQKTEASQPQNPKERIMAMLAAQQALQQAAQSQEQDPQQPLQSQPFQQPQQSQQSLQPQQSQPALQSQQNLQPSEVGVTTIARGTVIIGEINAVGDVELLGSVKGKIASQGDIRATGKIIGDLTGNSFTLSGCTIQGNITARGNVVIGQNTVIVGDIVAENIKLNGKVKGNLTIAKMSEFLENALLVGDVQAQTISMSQGAKLHGNVKVALDSEQGEKEFDSIFRI